MNYKKIARVICTLGFVLNSIAVYAYSARVDSLIKVYQSSSENEYERLAIRDLNNLYKEVSQEEALEWREWLEARFEKEDNRLGVALLKQLDAQRYFLAGEFVKAQQTAEESQRLWLALDDLKSWASSTLLLGNTYFFRERPFEAILQWQEAANIYELAFDSMNTAKCLSNIGAAYLQLDYMQSAYTSFERSTNLIPVEQRNSEAYQVARINTAVAAMELSLYPQAKVIFDELRSQQSATDYVTFLLDMNHMLYCMNTNDQEGFIQIMPTVLEGASTFSQHLPDVQESLAIGFLKFKDAEKARPFLEELKAIMQADSSYGTLMGLRLFVDYLQQTNENMLDRSLIVKLIDNLQFGVESKETIALYQLMALESAKASDYKAAYRWQFKVDSLKDNMMDSVLYTQFHDFSEAYRYRSVLEESEKLSQELAQNERNMLEIRYKNIYLTLFIGVSILLFSAIVYWRRRQANLLHQVPKDKR